jgi:alpha-D-ribose 1-methylphosphonate 5-triphosphate diphosphatase
MTETILTNARLVLRNEVVHGTIILRDGQIAEIQSGLSPNGTDLDGDYLIPGAIDIHTDNLERQVQPRIAARWPSRSALIAHDAQCAAAGVTTVYDALCLGDLGFDTGRIQTFRDGMQDIAALAPSGLLKSEHFIHLRCELPAVDMQEHVDPVADHPLVTMVSLMDHSPGVGQYANLENYRAMRLRSGIPPDRIESRMQELFAQQAKWRNPNRAWLLARIAHRNLPLLSHDDLTAANIAENVADNIMISEFPVAHEAADAAREAGMTIVAGAPNIVRGCSHSGNVSAIDLVRRGTMDAFASDYVPAALIEAAFACTRQADITLPDAIATITDTPAKMARLPDRGRIEPGLRADLVRVREHDGIPIVRAVWREGARVS